MRVSTVFVRFYRAFNFDYLRKNHPSARPDPWDMYEEVFYPYVQIELDDQITCVVGANESGKSQLLDAIRCALGIEPAKPSDFCRYSEFFTVGSDLRLPQFGLRLTGLDSDDRAQLSQLVPGGIGAGVDQLHVFRTGQQVEVYVGPATVPVVVEDTADFRAALPAAFTIETKKRIPNSVPYTYLFDPGAAAAGPTRVDRVKVLDSVAGNLVSLADAVAAKATDVATFMGFFAGIGKVLPATKEQVAEWALARDLLMNVGGIDLRAAHEVHDALRSETEGFANGLKSSMNKQLAEALNLRRWWTQDDRFELQIDLREFDLAFTIRDRTSREYSFDERSSGLRYFLSYLVQYLAHVSISHGDELLLMDEPDAFLSNQGQQDLLRLFQDFADRGSDGRSRQVVFVTHSPFLIDKNRADRVRVLDKGAQEVGTRVVHDAGRNHFEPLRSAFGGFVGESAFIGNCNLMVEGVADQVYLAGMSSGALRRGRPLVERLDLNELTLVPAGSASHIPYMVFLALGRDTDQPAVVVLLDRDKAGHDAAKDLAKGLRGKELLPSKYILQIGPDSLPTVMSERPGGPADIEDLVPVTVVLEAAKRFAIELDMADEPLPSAGQVQGPMDKDSSQKVGIYAATVAALTQVGSKLRLDKIGLARHVVAVLNAGDGTDPDVQRGRDNFAALFLGLGEMTRAATAERSRSGVGERVDRVIEAFLSDHPKRATRAELKVLLERIEALLDSSAESEQVHMSLRLLRTAHSLGVNLGDDIADLPSLRADLGKMKYAALYASQEHGTPFTLIPAPPDSGSAEAVSPAASLASDPNARGESSGGGVPNAH